MAELLINVLTGEVICVRDDGHPWGRMELIIPHWRLLHVPNQSRDALEYLTQPHPSRESQLTEITGAGLRLCVEAATGDLAMHLADDSRSRRHAVVSADVVRQLTERRTPAEEVVGKQEWDRMLAELRGAPDV
jgi:hypothetical protein